MEGPQKNEHKTQGTELMSPRAGRAPKTSTLRKYGLTFDEWEALFRSQDHRCAICFTATPGKQGWHTDHDHRTGLVRGILCQSCNFALGLIKDNIYLAHAMSVYLRKHNAETSLNAWEQSEVFIRRMYSKRPPHRPKQKIEKIKKLKAQKTKRKTNSAMRAYRERKIAERTKSRTDRRQID